MTSGTDDGDLRREIESCLRSERALVEFIGSLRDPDPTAPSRLPDWTVGHVMTHIARNADGVLSVFAGAPQYPRGLDGRNADIAAGSTRSWDDLASDVLSRSELVIDAMTARTDWSGTVRMLPGDRAMAQVPLLRQREVEVHRADLGLGYDFTDMPTEYVRRDLRAMEMLWTARRPMGMTALPDAALGADPPIRLAWLMGRVAIPGLAPAGLF